MTRKMYDSVDWSAIPIDAEAVAGYISPSGYTWPQAAWDRFPNAVHVRITPSASHTGLGVHVLDVETGDATPAQAPGWARDQRALGQDPTIYCSEGTWTTVQNAFNAQGVAQPHYWVAGYPGAGASIPAGAVGHQYADPKTSGGNYDLSVVADYWPGVDVVMTDPLNESVNREGLPGAPESGTTTLGVTVEYLDANLSLIRNAISAVAAQVASVQATVAKPVQATLTADQLTSIEQTVSTAVAGLDLSVSPTDPAAIAQAVAALLGAKLTA